MTTCNCDDGNCSELLTTLLKLLGDEGTESGCCQPADCGCVPTSRKTLGCIRVITETCCCCDGDGNGGGDDDGPLDLKKYKIVMPFAGSLDNKGTEDISIVNMLGTAAYDANLGMKGAGFVVDFSSFTWGSSDDPWTLSVWWNNSTAGPNAILVRGVESERPTYYTGFNCWSNVSGLAGGFNQNTIGTSYTPRGGLKHLVIDSHGNRYLNGDFIDTIPEGTGAVVVSRLNVFSNGASERSECGYISNLILHDKALSAERIKEIYELGATPYNL